MRLRTKVQPLWIDPRLLILTHYVQRQYCLLRPQTFWYLQLCLFYESEILYRSPTSQVYYQFCFIPTSTHPGHTTTLRHLPYFADVHASRLEVIVLGMIQRDITTNFTHIRESIYVLRAIIKVCERGKGATHQVTILKAATTKLRKDVDQLKSIYTLMIFGTVEIPDHLDIYIWHGLTCLEISPEMRLETMRWLQIPRLRLLSSSSIVTTQGYPLDVTRSTQPLRVSYKPLSISLTYDKRNDA